VATVLITGASRGLGYEFARQYAMAGWRVIATCRGAKDMEALTKLGSEVEVYKLDVTDHDQILALAHTLRRESIDVLLNNAGVHGPRPSRFGAIDYEAWEQVFRINTLGPMRMAECFVDHIARSDRKLIVQISSFMGSISGNEVGGAYTYRSTKAAVNAVTKNLAVDLRDRGIIVISMHPGWVTTDMGGPGADLEPTESIRAMRKVFEGIKRGDTGQFLNYDGSIISW
jgi:NAD(P)-dependent dehydrogenase (short-subunit alcohol dehydrogenase family)